MKSVRLSCANRSPRRRSEAFDSQHTVGIEGRARVVQAPTLIAWDTDDIACEISRRTDDRSAQASDGDLANEEAVGRATKPWQQ